MKIKDDWVYLVLHLLVIGLLFGLLLFLAVDSYWLLPSVAACWGFLILGDIMAIFMAIVVLPIWYPTTWRKLLNPIWSILFNRPFSSALDPRLRETIVELGQLSFTLEDPEEPDALEDYLAGRVMESEAATRSTPSPSETSRRPSPGSNARETPELASRRESMQPSDAGIRPTPARSAPKSPSRRESVQSKEKPDTVTPRQMIEDLVLREAAAIEKKFVGQVTVKAIVRPGSLVVLLTFCGTAYVALSQYHDVIESIQLLRQQVRQAYQNISQGYQNRTGHTARTRSEVVINDLSAARAATTYPVNPPGTVIPSSVSNTLAPSLAGDSVSVNVGTGTNRSSIIGCLTLFALFAILAVLLLVGYCDYTGETGVCSDVFGKIIDVTRRVLLDLGAFFTDLGQMFSAGS